MPEAGPGTLGQAIKARRTELGLSQWDLAYLVDDQMQQGDVSKLERGVVTLPRRPRLERIAAALNLSLGELLARSGWNDAESYWTSDDMERAATLISPREVLARIYPELDDARLDELTEVARVMLEERAGYEAKPRGPKRERR